MDKEVNQGPLVNQNQFDKVSGMVNEAVEKGANVVSGGSKHDMGDLFYKPTILTDVTTDMLCFKDEIFGPVLSIARFATEDEALAIANDCRVGLAGYFYSNDVRQCWRVAKKLEVGMVGINEGMISAPEAAFGGIKESGLGREGSRHGMDEYSDIKYLCFDPSRPRPDSLIPPKAASGALIIPSLIPTIPTSNFLATRQHCRTSFE
jgi:succinate-semialdehyde dehydrogenase